MLSENPFLFLHSLMDEDNKAASLCGVHDYVVGE